MASTIYLYSKFTEEFLLLTAAGIFTLLSFYCYTWVVKKRRLGAARDQVPAGLVKVYLGQLINEAQFVRTQLFGLAGGSPPTAESLSTRFQANGDAASSKSGDALASFNPDLPADLVERLKALENQLAEKETMVVNINVEKTKLLEEVENLKQNEKATRQATGSGGGNEDLLQKMKALEERLEEYALFEDDLANLKRLQQENAALKKQIDANVAPQSPEPAPAPSPEPEIEVPATKVASLQPVLDQAAIDALLDGISAVPPTPTAEAEQAEKDAIALAALDQGTETATVTPLLAKVAGIETQSSAVEAASIASKSVPAADAPLTSDTNSSIANHAETLASIPVEAIASGQAEAPPAPVDAFENLVDSVEDSLAAGSSPSHAPEKVLESVTNLAPSPEATASALAEKTDEELLKEFESLLNS